MTLMVMRKKMAVRIMNRPMAIKKMVRKPVKTARENLRAKKAKGKAENKAKAKTHHRNKGPMANRVVNRMTNRAAGNRNQEGVAVLLAHGADVSSSDREGNTPLHYAVSWQRGDPAVPRLLLNSGADPNAVNNEGETPLHGAALRGDVPSVKLLLGAGADGDIRDKKGATPLDVAAERGNEEARKALEASLERTDALDKQEVILLLRTAGSRELGAVLARLETPDALPVLAEVVRDEDVPLHVRMRATTVMGRIGTRAARDALIDALGKTHKPSIFIGNEGKMWSGLVDAVGNCIDKETNEQLVLDLDHANPHVRWLAAMRLGKRKHAGSVEALIALLDDPHPDPRLGATWALGEIQDPKGIEQLIAIVEKRRDGGSRISAIEAMGKIATPRAIEAIHTVKPGDPEYWKAEKTLKELDAR